MYSCRESALPEIRKMDAAKTLLTGEGSTLLAAKNASCW
jgi:hypothetical protein